MPLLRGLKLAGVGTQVAVSIASLNTPASIERIETKQRPAGRRRTGCLNTPASIERIETQWKRALQMPVNCLNTPASIERIETNQVCFGWVWIDHGSEHPCLY